MSSFDACYTASSSLVFRSLGHPLSPSPTITLRRRWCWWKQYATKPPVRFLCLCPQTSSYCVSLHCWLTNSDYILFLFRYDLIYYQHCIFIAKEPSVYLAHFFEIIQLDYWALGKRYRAVITMIYSTHIDLQHV